MENIVSLTNRTNFGVRKLESKLISGPTVQRSVLGNIQNKNAILKPQGLQKKDQDVLKKPVVSKNFLQRNVPKETKAAPKKSLEKEQQPDKCVESLSTAFSSNILSIKDIDEEDGKNPQLLSAYVKDIYKYLWELEDLFPMKTHYLENHQITSRMRNILIDWLVQVHLRFTLLPETLYLTVSIIDRYLQAKKNLGKDKLQLVGVTAMFIASKYEEMYIPEIGDFVYITDRSSSKRDIRLMEIDILSTLKFFLGFPLQLHFLRRNSKAGEVDAMHHSLAKYIMELTLPEYGFAHYKASLIAAGALYLSLKLLPDGQNWDGVLSHYSSYSEDKVAPVAYKMASLLIKSASGTSKQQAIRSKYKNSKLMKISTIPELSPNSKTLKNLAAKAGLQ